MEKQKILVVDDEQDLCEILVFNLTTAGYAAEAVCCAEDALAAGVGRYDLLLLDVMMPGMSGFELARRLKGDEQTAHIPIIFLTAKDAEDDTLQGFGLGADDYVTKPFSVREVMARVRAVLHRTVTTPEQPSATVLSAEVGYRGLTVDTVGKHVTADGAEVSLTRTEFDLLCQLLVHRGEVFSRQQLLSSVWPKDVVVTDRTVDVTIARLRKKIGAYAANIATRQGFGYLFEE